MTARPHAICQACYDEQRALFVGRSFLYCEHFRAMARRRSPADAWTVARKVSPETARQWVNKALEKLKQLCEKQGITFEAQVAALQRLYERDGRP